MKRIKISSKIFKKFYIFLAFAIALNPLHSSESFAKTQTGTNYKDSEENKDLRRFFKNLFESEKKKNDVALKAQKVNSKTFYYNKKEFKNNEGGVLGKALDFNKREKDSKSLIPGVEIDGSVLSALSPGDTGNSLDNLGKSFNEPEGVNVDIDIPDIDNDITSFNSPDEVILQIPTDSDPKLRIRKKAKKSIFSNLGVADKPKKKNRMIPKRRPDPNYRNVKLPSLIYKESYSRINRHLPIAHYEHEYNNILFNKILEEDLTIIRAMVERIGGTEVKNDQGDTPLLFALKNGRHIAAKVLIGMDASIYSINNEGESPLTYILASNNKNLVNFAMSRGFDPKKFELISGEVLIGAVRSNNIDMVSYALDNNADTSFINNKGNSALHYAAMSNKYEIARKLINGNADINQKNADGYTPLMIAASTNNSDIVNLLILENADLNIKDSFGRDALQIANQTNSNESFNLLDAASLSKIAVSNYDDSYLVE